jgi:hypothetical protein
MKHGHLHALPTELFFGIVKQTPLSQCTLLSLNVSAHPIFDIKRSRQGYWIVRDRDGLAGGTFLTCKDAVRFALFETGGDSAHVHAYPEPKAARIDGPRAHRRTPMRS